jgi:hypothetical protein
MHATLPLDATPLRTHMVIRVSPATKAMLIERSAALGVSLTRLLDRAGPGLEGLTLARLPPEHHSAYLAGTLTFEATFGRSPRQPRSEPGVRVNLSAEVLPETRAALRRYAAFYESPMGDVLATLAKHLKPPKPPPAPAEKAGPPAPAADEQPDEPLPIAAE